MKNAALKELERLLNLSINYLTLLKKTHVVFWHFKNYIDLKCSFLLRGVNSGI